MSAVGMWHGVYQNWLQKQWRVKEVKNTLHIRFGQRGALGM
jgi:hypothetical protein